MPVYKQRRDFLTAAVQSVLAQTYRDFRFVLVIDGAPEMEPLVRELIAGDARARIIAYPDNRGVASALNAGFEPLLADPSIQYLTWVSTDNVYDPDYVGVLRSALVQGQPELGIAFSSFRSIDDEGRQLRSEAELAALRVYQAQPEDRLLDYSMVGVSFMYKAEYARQIAGYGMQPVEDYDYWLRLSERCRMKHLPVELMDYRVDSAHSISAQLRGPLEHRRWRYTYHLARHQARMRRGIPQKLTVLFPLGLALDNEIAVLEDLYEQSFSNYGCIVLDLSESQQPTAALGAISHPTTSFRSLPGMEVSPAILYAAQSVATPYVLVLGPGRFHGVVDLQGLIDYADASGKPGELSWFYGNGPAPAPVSIRRETDTTEPPGKPNLFHELFRTDGLIRLLRSILGTGGPP